MSEPTRTPAPNGAVPPPRHPHPVVGGRSAASGRLAPDEHGIREMTLADCAAVAEIRVRGWQTAYRGLMPRSYLDALSVREDAARRRELLVRSDGSVVNLVAERDGTVVGWAAYGPYRDGDAPTADGELYALYVHPARYGGGAGRLLLQESVRRCAAAGHDRMFLWVLKGNARARRFYERSGFRADGAEEPFEAGGAVVPELRYVRELCAADVTSAGESAPAPAPPPRRARDAPGPP
ncbi:GNAT family N-acetyltransferase [Streptomyces bullii]|uniref:GNAT family N-acetyltransferase n=1 Tax=Streptomyces bullii TaxID=349910 RepID=A0ABW0USR6_9ACTN